VGAAKDFALQVPNNGADCTVTVTETRGDSAVYKFKRESGLWGTAEAVVSESSSPKGHRFDEGGVCVKCGCSTVAVKQFNFSCSEDGAVALSTKSRKASLAAVKQCDKGTDFLGKIWPVCLICLVLGVWIAASASEDVQKTAGIVGLTLICASLIVFAVAMLIDYYSLPPDKREPATYSSSPRSTRYYPARSRARRGGHYGKMTAAASLYAAGQLRQINQKLDQADSEGGGSDSGGL
jgi:hypothetical protein